MGAIWFAVALSAICLTLRDEPTRLLHPRGRIPTGGASFASDIISAARCDANNTTWSCGIHAVCCDVISTARQGAVNVTRCHGISAIRQGAVNAARYHGISAIRRDAVDIAQCGALNAALSIDATLGGALAATQFRQQPRGDTTIYPVGRAGQASALRDR